MNFNFAIQGFTSGEIPIPAQRTSPTPTEGMESPFRKLKESIQDRMEGPQHKGRKKALSEQEHNDIYAACAPQTTTQQPDQPVSICLNSESEASQGIDGILEGFGLLNDADGTAAITSTAPFFAPEQTMQEGDNGPQDAEIPLDQPMQTQQQEQQQGTALSNQDGSLENINNPINNEAHAEAVPPALEDNKQKADEPGKAQHNLRDLIDAAMRNARRGDRVQPAKSEGESASAGNQPSFGLVQHEPRVQSKQEAAEMPKMSLVTQQDMADNVTRLVDRITAACSSHEQEFTIDLKPEFLGRLSIKLIMDAEGIRAQIKAGDASVKGMIQTELVNLENTLRDKGIQITQIDVAYQPAAAFNFQQHASHQENSANTSLSKNKKLFLDANPTVYDQEIIMRESYMEDLHAKNSSIEFRA